MLVANGCCSRASGERKGTKLQVPVLYFDTHYLREFLMGGMGMGKGGNFKLNKHEFRCMEENIFVYGLGFFFLVARFLADFFFKGTELYGIFFIFNP